MQSFFFFFNNQQSLRNLPITYQKLLRIYASNFGGYGAPNPAASFLNGDFLIGFHTNGVRFSLHPLTNCSYSVWKSSKISSWIHLVQFSDKCLQETLFSTWAVCVCVCDCANYYVSHLYHVQLLNTTNLVFQKLLQKKRTH